MLSYEVLNKLPPEAFLNPENFATDWDNMRFNLDNAEREFQRGKQTSNECKEIFIAINGTWQGTAKDGEHICSYERIGYHANTKHFWRGVLAGSAKIIVCRRVDGGIQETMIRD